jgi:hypothetical protein
MRIRTVKPEFWSNEKLSECSEFAHLLACALLNYADDEGYFNANPKLIAGSLFPLREPSVSIHGALSELSNQDFLRLCRGLDGRTYGHICSFERHQKINRPSPSRIKHLCNFSEHSVNPHGTLNDPSLPEQGSGNREQGSGNRDLSCPSEEGSGEISGKPKQKELPELRRRIICCIQKTVRAGSRDKSEDVAWKKVKDREDLAEEIELLEKFYAVPKAESCDQTWKRKVGVVQLMNQWVEQLELADAYFSVKASVGIGGRRELTEAEKAEDRKAEEEFLKRLREQKG